MIDDDGGDVSFNNTYNIYITSYDCIKQKFYALIVATKVYIYLD